MRINYNVSAMITNNALSKSEDALSKSLERLSSGLKINHAKDNPAGLAMSKRMNAQIEGLSVASQNASDGVSIIETADGAMSEIQSMLQRISELAIKASNGVITDDDREMVQKEVNQLKEEIQRIADETQFNGQKLLNGEFGLKGYTTEESIQVTGYSKDVPQGIYTIDSLTVIEVDGVKTVDLTNGVEFGDFFPEDAEVTSCEEGIITISASQGFEMQIDIGQAALGTYADLSVDALGIGAMRLQIGANEGQVLGLIIPAVSLKNMGMENVDLSTSESADAAITSVKNAIQYVSDVRSRLGAYQNRLESTISTLGITSENMTAAYSRITDVDMAEEMTNYTTYQVLTQAGTSMLAQANERPSQVLQLLQ